MKNNKLSLLYVFFLSAVLFSCKNNTAEPVTTQEDVHQHQTTATEATQELRLDHGNKWQVNDQMKPYVEQGEQMVADYINSAATDYKNLAEQLKEQNSLLIKSCTMTGEAHDELHKWLHPHLDLVKELEAAPTAREATVVVEKLQASYTTYSGFFQ
ncbi:MAG: hypothetical protein WCY89_02225 [Flavobacteriaceae bacterium]